MLGEALLEKSKARLPRLLEQLDLLYSCRRRRRRRRVAIVDDVYAYAAAELNRDDFSFLDESASATACSGRCWPGER